MSQNDYIKTNKHLGWDLTYHVAYLKKYLLSLFTPQEIWADQGLTSNFSVFSHHARTIMGWTNYKSWIKRAMIPFLSQSTLKPIINPSRRPSGPCWSIPTSGVQSFFVIWFFCEEAKHTLRQIWTPSNDKPHLRSSIPEHPWPGCFTKCSSSSSSRNLPWPGRSYQ